MSALHDSNRANKIASLEDILNPKDVQSSVLPRWQRKAMARSDSNSSDRFIPNRSEIDFEGARHNMHDRRGEAAKADECDSDAENAAKRDAALKAGLLSGGSLDDGEGSRVLAYESPRGEGFGGRVAAPPRRGDADIPRGGAGRDGRGAG